jgi:hypothetical protein
MTHRLKHIPTRLDPLTTVYDPVCIKTPEAPKLGEWLAEITQNRPRSEIVVVLIVIRGEISHELFRGLVTAIRFQAS